MKNITVIGAGTMGNGIAHVFAMGGHQVNLVDISKEALDKGIATIEKNLGRMVAREKITEAEKKATLGRIQTFTDTSKGVANANLVVEAATEDISLKIRIFKEMDEHAPEGAILATNTSSISITKIAAATQRPGQVIGMHFMNPVPIMKLVEIIRGYATTDKTTSAIMGLSKKLGKAPVEVNDYPGFISNRILMPMINEAVYALYEGVAEPEGIDSAMTLGTNQPMGPLTLADFIGLDVCLSILKVMYDGFKNPKYAPCPLLVNMVMAGKLGIKSGEGFYDYSESKKAEKVAKMFQS